jgi:hypothetical protein
MCQYLSELVDGNTCDSFIAKDRYPINYRGRDKSQTRPG